MSACVHMYVCVCTMLSTCTCIIHTVTPECCAQSLHGSMLCCVHVGILSCTSIWITSTECMFGCPVCSGGWVCTWGLSTPPNEPPPQPLQTHVFFPSLPVYGERK